MSITAEDIQNEGFEHSLRGYDVQQVDVFLERVANEVDEMNKTIADLTEQLETARDQAAGARAELEEARAADAAGKAAASPAAEEAGAADGAELASARAEVDKANKKVADALVRAENAEARAKEAERRAGEAEAQIEPLKEQLAEKNKLDSAISEAFISAQRSADQLKEEAREEGERIYRESEAKAREFIREALAKKASIFAEIEALQDSAERFRGDYTKLVDGFAADAKERFKDMTPPEIPDGIVNELLPDIEDMPVPEDEQASPAPRIDGDSIPTIEDPE